MNFSGHKLLTSFVANIYTGTFYYSRYFTTQWVYDTAVHFQQYIAALWRCNKNVIVSPTGN